MALRTLLVTPLQPPDNSRCSHFYDRCDRYHAEPEQQQKHDTVNLSEVRPRSFTLSTNCAQAAVTVGPHVPRLVVFGVRSAPVSLAMTLLARIIELLCFARSSGYPLKHFLT